MNDRTKPTILVIIGVTGDLSRRKLLPAIEEIAKAGAEPEKFRIVGVTRRKLPIADVLGKLTSPAPHSFLEKHIQLHQMDLTDLADYKLLGEYLDAVERELGGPAQRLFYLSVPPQVSRPIVALLGESGLAAAGAAKLLLEKPFGTDLVSAEELVAQTKQYFEEEQIYRIDHYLAKEMAQNFIVFRADNSLFKRTWNKDFIERIEIIATERIGIEGRAVFYEQTGALRDTVQSHLLQLAALALMHTPRTKDLRDVPALRHEALRQLHVPAGLPTPMYAKRGQYQGYRDEVGIDGSNVETFADLTFISDDPRWTGVPIRVVTGKALSAKTTHIRIVYKREEAHEANELIIKLQPNEGVELCLWTKVPGYVWKVENHSLGMAFKDHFTVLPDAYERVFLDAINSNHTLFTSSDEVLETWRILAPVQQAWAQSDDGLIVYEPKSTIEDVVGR